MVLEVSWIHTITAYIYDIYCKLSLQSPVVVSCWGVWSVVWKQLAPVSILHLVHDGAAKLLGKVKSGVLELVAVCRRMPF